MITKSMLEEWISEGAQKIPEEELDGYLGKEIGYIGKVAGRPTSWSGRIVGWARLVFEIEGIRGVQYQLITDKGQVNVIHHTRSIVVEGATPEAVLAAEGLIPPEALPPEDIPSAGEVAAEHDSPG